LSVLGGGTRPSAVWRKAIEGAACVQRQLGGGILRPTGLVAAGLLLMGVAGCGASGGVSSDAVVTAYVEAPLCTAAKQELAKHDGRAGDLRVQAICLISPRNAKRLSLATLGANARRATEDSTAVAFLEAPDPKASRFVHPILETAQVPWISAGSGAAAMSRLLSLIPDADSGSLRESLREELNET
jgi:hypothetical protein